MALLMRKMWERREDKPFSASWVVEHPTAHPIWTQYVGGLYDLTTDVGEEPKLYGPGVNYEFLLWVMDPDHPYKDGEDLHLLTPPNHGYQFWEPDDQTAFARIDQLMMAVAEHKLSPDVDYTPVWDRFFTDGYSLKNATPVKETVH